MIDIEQYSLPKLKPKMQSADWAHKYCYDVLKGNIPACQSIKHAAMRHFNDLERDDLYWCEETAASIVKFFKFIPITDGANKGKPTVLLPWQIWVVCSMVAWRWKYDTFDEDGNPETVAGERRFLQAVVLIARKAGKTTIAAGVNLWLMIKAGHQPRSYCVATKRDQAKILWETAKIMIELSPRLRTLFENRANEIKMPNKHGIFRPLASDSNSLDGLNPICIIGDEGHSWKDDNLYRVCVSSFGAQTEYMMLMISTAGFLVDNVLARLVKNGKRVLDPNDEAEQDNFFYAMFQMDEDDDWTGDLALYKANAGAVYGLPSMRYLKAQRKEAQMDPVAKGAFLTKHLNLFVTGFSKWLDLAKFKQGARDFDISQYHHKECYIGFDRAQVSDISSASVLFPTTDGGCDVIVFNLQSQGAFDDAGDYLKNIYKLALDEEDLEIIDGAFVRSEVVKDFLRSIAGMFPKNKGIYYDPYHMKEVALDLEDEGLTMVSVSMGPGNVSEPAKKMEMLIGDGLFRYHRSPLLEYAASCALIKVNTMSNSMVIRDPNQVKTDRIDPLIATLIALSGATLIKEEKNVYNERGLLRV